MKKSVLALLLLLAASPLVAETRIVVVGATADMRLVERWAQAENEAVTDTPGFQSFQVGKSDMSVTALSPTTSLSSIANALFNAEVAMIVMDATAGPTHDIREYILLSRQAGVPLIATMMTNVDGLFEFGFDDYRELLELQVDELRNVLSLYEVGGPNTPLFDDSKERSRAPRSSNGSFADIGGFISHLDTQRENPTPLASRKSARAQVYFLADAEANGHAIWVGRQRKLKMWCAGSSTLVDVSSEEPYGPGDLGSIIVSASQSFSAALGSRILLLNNGHVVGLGVISKFGDL